MIIILLFTDFYKMSNDHLGTGAYASVRTAISIETGVEYAVKVVDKHVAGHTRSRILREVDIFKMCRNHPNIVQLVEVSGKFLTFIVTDRILLCLTNPVLFSGLKTRTTSTWSSRRCAVALF